MTRYVFWIETEAGERTEWRGLTQREAGAMYGNTRRFQPHNVVRYGWEEMK